MWRKRKSAHCCHCLLPDLAPCEATPCGCSGAEAFLGQQQQQIGPSFLCLLPAQPSGFPTHLGASATEKSCMVCWAPLETVAAERVQYEHNPTHTLLTLPLDASLVRTPGFALPLRRTYALVSCFLAYNYQIIAYINIATSTTTFF